MRHFRWWIAGLLALATAFSYLDRQTFPVLQKMIREDIPFTDAQFSRLNALFLIAYGLMYAVGGRILDLLGTRVGYALMIGIWSLANAATGFARSVSALGACRFTLGMGEGGGFPASGKAVAEWFPARERSFAFGLFNTGSALGSAVATPAVNAIGAALGWPWAFFLTGGAGALWAVGWLYLYSTPDRSVRLGPEERAYLERERPKEVESGPKIRWRDLFRFRQVWGLMAAKLLTDTVWFFLLFWIPKYLNDQRGFNTKETAAYAWIPYAAAGAGSFLGGWLGTYLIRRGAELDRARKICLSIAAGLMPATLLIVASPTAWAIVFFSAALFAHQFWSANVQTLAADLFPSRVVGSVEGLLGSAGALGAGLAQLYLGEYIGRRGYAIPFALAGVMHLGALALIFLIVRRIEPALKQPGPFMAS
jgi:MFS transporter, ACS family, hexuronate transporter